MNLKQIDFLKNDCAEVFTTDKVHALANLKNQAIFITGGSGFMGKWILEAVHFLNTNFSFNTKLCVYAPSASRLVQALPHLFTTHPAELIDGDVKNIFDISKEFTYVLHAAGTPDNRMQSTNPLRIIETINNGTNNVLEASSRLPQLENFLNISSGHIYGLNLDNEGNILEKVSEDQLGVLDCNAIASLYAESKRMGETLCAAYRAQYRMQVTSLRPFAFIGPHQQLDRPWAINNFFNDALHGGPIKILGNDETVRSYMYPSDMAYWVLRFLVGGQNGQVLNLGSPDGKTLRDVAQTVADNYSNNISIASTSSRRVGNKSVFVPDTTKAKELYDLDISVNFEDAILKTYKWFSLSN